MVCRRLVLLFALGALLGAPVAAQAAPPLLGQWPLDNSYEDGANQVTPDASGNGFDLRVSNGSMHLGTPGRFGTGATLGTNLTPLQITSPLLAPAQVTLLAWIKQSGNPGTLRYIAGRGDDGLTCGGSTFALYSGYPGMPGLRFYVRGGAAGVSALTSAPADATVFNGQWHLIAGTYDGATARLYVDGVLVGSPVPAPSPLTYALGGGSSFYVDGYPVVGCALGANADDWPGPIDEVRVYARALSSSELARLAAATGPTAPELVTDASLVAPPPVAPAPGPAAPLSPQAAVASLAPAAAQGLAGPLKAVQLQALKEAAAGVSGASRKRPTDAAEAALAAAEAQALAAMKEAAGSSRVAAARPAKELSAKEERQTRSDPKVQARLEAMKYGIEAQVPAAAGQIVEAVATIVLEKKSNGKVRTQTIVLPPAVGVAETASKEAALQFAVDKKATAAMTKEDVAKAAMSVQAVALDSPSDVGETNALRLQQALDTQGKTAELLSNVLKKLQTAQQEMTQNLKGGLADSERKQQQDLNAKAAKLDKQAQAIERQRDAANQKATEATQQAVSSLIAGIVGAAAQVGVAGASAGTGGGGPAAGGSLPKAATSLSGCKRCEFGAVASN